MKPFRVHPASCSCTGCIYRSRSKEPNVQQAIQGGSEIDKLYYGKFLPLRERKLLEKLIKTRDVYDDVRNQLLSSASSDKIEHKKKRRDDSMPDKGSTVLKMVDLVDRRKMGSGYTSKLSSCCSCCSCETLRKIRRRMEKDKKKHPTPSCYRHIVTCEDIAKYCAEAEERGRKRRRKLSTQISTKVSSKVGAARLKIKKHLSEPVISSVSMDASKAFMNKMRSKRKAKKTALARKVEAIDQETGNVKVSRKPRKKVKNVQSSTTKDSGTQLKSPITYKSPTAFRIKKDSKQLFKEKLLKKRTYKENRDVECEPETCEEDTCTPEECLRKIKAKGVGVTRKRKSHSRYSDTGRDGSHVSVSSRTKKVQVREPPQRSVSKSASKKPRETHEKATRKKEKPLKPTKSASSMASIAKLKAKSQFITTDDKPTSKSKPKSDMGNVKCECKPSTKSTSSATSFPQKQFSRSVPKVMHELSRKKSRRKSLYNLDEADLLEPKEHVKATREKHVKLTHGRIKQRKKHRHGKMQSKVSQESHLRESASQASKFYHGNLYRSKHNESKSAGSFVKKTKSISKEPPQERVKDKTVGMCGCYADELQREQTAAVKISSTFSFGIEFYKETFPDECCECEKKVGKKMDSVSRHQKKIKQKEHRTKYKDHGTGHTRIRPRHNISSQSSSSQSYKNIQVGHKLKRCFCTLKLKDKKIKIKHGTSKKTMVALRNKELEMLKKKQTQTKLAGITYVVPPATAAKHVSKETNTAVTPRASAYTSQPVSKATSRKIQSSEIQKIKQKGRHSQSPNIESEVLFDTSGRQAKVASDKCERHCAVRIGSSLSFGIEFSKSNLNCDTENVLISDKPKRRERKHLHQKGIKFHKPRVRHETSETTKDVKTKQTHTEPFLQRCLCTLKLMKKNKKKVEKPSPWRNRNEYVMHMQNNSITTNRAEIRYNHERLKIFPYEYGAGLCISKEFDPYYCEKLTKLRQVKLQKYKNIVDLGYQPTLSKNIISSKSRDTQSLTKQSYQKVKNINPNYHYSRTKLRVLQVASNLNNSLINKKTHNKDKINTMVRKQFDRPAHYESIEETSCKEKESSPFSVIKRIFSTSIFQKKRGRRQENKNININELTKTYYQLPDSEICDYKSPHRRSSKLSYDLSGHECALNPCMPVRCDLYKCSEDHKRRKNKRLNICYVSTNKREKKSTMSITTSVFSGSTSAKSTQSRLLKHKTSKDQKVRDKQKDLNTASSFSPSRQPVLKGSNFSLNKDFSKKRLVSLIQDTEFRESNRRIKNRTKISNNKNRTKNTVRETPTINAMPNKFRKEVKASNVGFLLKRCLCTLGLQKKNVPKPEFCWQQPITTQFVQLEHNKNKMYIHNNVTKSGRHVPDKTLYGRESLKLKLPEGSNVFRKNLIVNQNGIKNPHPQHLPNSSSYPNRPHIRSSININFGKMRNLLNIQKVNPFYKSFYALNVRVSKTKNKSHDKYRGFNDNEYESNDCEPVECSNRKTVLKRIKPELKCVKPKTACVSRSTDCYERCRKKFEKRRRPQAPKRFSTTRNLSKQNTKSVTCKYYLQQVQKNAHRKDKNKVTFCNSVDCLLFEQAQKQRNRSRGRGDGDADKKHGPDRKVKEQTMKENLFSPMNEKLFSPMKEKLFSLFCRCKPKIRKCQGKKLRQKVSMETIRVSKKKCCKHDRAEREMETIMPYSKRKFKSVDSRSKLAGKRVCDKCKAPEERNGKEKSKDRGKNRERVKNNKTFKCLCKTRRERKGRGDISERREKEETHVSSGSLQETAGHRRRSNMKVLCPVCKAKAAGEFDITKLKEPCTCMEEEKIEEPKKDTSQCPMCKQNYDKNVSMCPCCEKPFDMSDRNKPLFQMTVNKTNMRIVNKDEVIKKMGSSAKAVQKAQRAMDLAQFHSSDCKCCICKLKATNAKVLSQYSTKAPPKLNPCICGSAVCKKDWNELKKRKKNWELRQRLNLQRCVCGTTICEEESQKMPELLLEAAQQAERDQQLEKIAKKKEKLYQEQRMGRIKDHAKAVKKQLLLQKLNDRKQMKFIRKNENPSDLALITESLIDLGTFGSKAFCDIAKYICKGIRHPRDIIGDIEDMSRDPGHAMGSTLKTAETFGLSGVIERIKARLTKMRTAKSVFSTMEGHPATHYLAHITDQDPQTRMQAFKKKRTRVPRGWDFECSLYMASMRKRPCLRVYYMCPWFYPHCMSLLGIWKQFMDILMFICAVLIWSPCIACMEICRGCVCCFMCQG